MSSVLVVEDDPKIRAGLLLQLEEEGYEARGVAEAEAALELLDGEGPFDLLLLDVRLPGMSGVDLVRALAEAGRLPPTVVVSGEASISETVEALRLGVHDFIEKPFRRERLLQSLRNALENARLRRDLATLTTELAGSPQLLGSSAAIGRVREQIDMAAPTDARVLILGESGTGKELVADALHRGSRRRDRPFIKVNCAAIPEQLIEAELFGHARGAFTDARTAKAGLFEEADGGTLFLDEIGDMAVPLQARLLRVVEDGKVRRVGESRDRQVDVRLLAATHQELEEAVKEGSFRRDLYFRLSNLPIRVPPLRQRREDVRPLFLHFVELFRVRHRTGRRRVDEAVFPLLEHHPWPGNVRELKALAERLVIFGGDPITVGQLPEGFLRPDAAEAPDLDLSGLALPALEEGATPMPLKELRARCERAYIEKVLAHTGWNFTAAARLLGLERTYLHQKAAALGVRRPRP